MKKLSILAAFVSLGAASAWATNACPDTPTALTSYLASGFSCEVGDKVFSNFTYTDSSSGGALAIGPGSVTVETIGSLTGNDPAEVAGTNIGLEFNASWLALPSQETDSDIGFTVTVINGANMTITDTGLAQTSGVTATSGDASVTEKACAPGLVNGVPCTPNTQAALTFDQGGSNSQVVQDNTITPTGSITVSKDITVVDQDPTGTRGSQAELSLVSDTFSQSPTAVPEPATMALAGFALCGFAAFRRRRSA